VNATLGQSLSGSTLMVVGPPNSISQIGVEAQSLINPSHVDLAEGDSLTISPIQLWEQNPVTVSSGGDIVVMGVAAGGP